VAFLSRATNYVPDDTNDATDGFLASMYDEFVSCPCDVKANPGVCGCGIPDTDEDGNGVIDCIQEDPPPSPTPTPEGRVSLRSVCSEDPYTELRWEVTNTHLFPYEITWDVKGTAQSGTLLVPANGKSYFYTETVPNEPNVVRLYDRGSQV